MLKFSVLFSLFKFRIFSAKQATRTLKPAKPKKCWGGRIRIIIGISMILGVCVFGSWFFQANRFPITTVKVVGTRQHTSTHTLNSVIFSHIQAGFFSVNVSNLQHQLLLLPWVKQADVRRVWPGQLVVSISEQNPSAIWNQEAVLSIDGELFYPNKSDLKTLDVPQFYGPEGQEMQVWQQYLNMEATISSLQLRIRTLELAERGAWQIELSNGIRVILGTQDIPERMQRFVKAYKRELMKKPQKINYVDLRYTNGMAVGWKSSS